MKPEGKELREQAQLQFRERSRRQARKLKRKKKVQTAKLIPISVAHIERS
jgi:hypothetical protein